ncbi:guanylate-binding protein 1-like [Panicum miliaceum]|uniref:Guanylate-binding protein 1-like n=1 Tax=Panicum miliaceum TaxID=4540 RepID=A0A3L6Q5T6_PANMI|nr:guanylate-binding protein 1-like [Panicum miliaceum]
MKTADDGTLSLASWNSSRTILGPGNLVSGMTVVLPTAPAGSDPRRATSGPCYRMENGEFWRGGLWRSHTTWVTVQGKEREISMDLVTRGRGRDKGAARGSELVDLGGADGVQVSWDLHNCPPTPPHPPTSRAPAVLVFHLRGPRRTICLQHGAPLPKPMPLEQQATAGSSEGQTQQARAASVLRPGGHLRTPPGPERSESLPSFLIAISQPYETKPGKLWMSYFVSFAKVLSNTVKQKMKEKAGKWDVPLPKVRPVAEEKMFKVMRTGKRKIFFYLHIVEEAECRRAYDSAVGTYNSCFDRETQIEEDYKRNAFLEADLQCSNRVQSMELKLLDGLLAEYESTAYGPGKWKMLATFLQQWKQVEASEGHRAEYLRRYEEVINDNKQKISKDYSVRITELQIKSSKLKEQCELAIFS